MAIIAYDSFNRANNTTSMGISDTGQTWRPLDSSKWGIRNNQAYHIFGEDAMTVVETGVSDCTVSAVIVSGPEGRGICFRQTKDGHATGFQVQFESDRINVYLRSQGWISVGAYDMNTSTIRSGAIIKAVLLGSSIKIYLDDLNVINFTSTVQMNETQHGIGTWQDGPVFDDFKVETAGGSPPIVNVLSANRTKISSKAGVNQSIIKVTFDKNVEQYVARLNGASYDTGVLVHSGGAVSAGVQADVIIDWNELTTEGNNKINVYGCSNGVWSAL